MGRLDTRVTKLERAAARDSSATTILRQQLQAIMRRGSRLPFHVDGEPPLPLPPDDDGTLMRLLQGESWRHS